MEEAKPAKNVRDCEEGHKGEVLGFYGGIMAVEDGIEEKAKVYKE